jgi:glutaredoxin
MNLFFRLFFTSVRPVLALFVLGFEKLSPGRLEVQRSVEEQARIDESLRDLRLYQFRACPFCVKVRREIRRLGLHKLELREATEGTPGRQELLEGGGEVQTPCLRIQDATTGAVQWLYESDKINAYLQKRFGAGASASLALSGSEAARL